MVILDGLREIKLSANFHFGVNYPIKNNTARKENIKIHESNEFSEDNVAL